MDVENILSEFYQFQIMTYVEQNIILQVIISTYKYIEFYENLASSMTWIIFSLNFASSEVMESVLQKVNLQVIEFIEL